MYKFDTKCKCFTFLLWLVPAQRDFVSLQLGLTNSNRRPISADFLGLFSWIFLTLASSSADYLTAYLEGVIVPWLSRRCKKLYHTISADCYK